MARESFNTYAAVWAADAFRANAQTSWEKADTSLSQESIDREAARLGQHIASSTNLFFAAELYLKALAFYAAPSVPKAHRLTELYAHLDTEAQQRIQETYDRLRAGEYQWLDALQFYLNNYKGDEPPAVDTADALHELPAFLARSTDGFTTWRYFHELWSQEGAILVYEHRLLDHFCQAIRDEFERRLHERGTTFPAQEPR